MARRGVTWPPTRLRRRAGSSPSFVRPPRTL